MNVQSDHGQRLRHSVVLHLHIDNRVSGRVQDTPKLLLGWVHVDHGGPIGRIRDRNVVERNIPSRCTTVLVSGRHRIVANHQNAGPQSGNQRIHVLNSFNDQRPGRAAEHRGFGDTVNVRVIPVQSWRLILRELQRVCKRISRINDGSDHLVLMTGGGVFVP